DLAGDRNVTAVLLDDRANNRQPETGASNVGDLLSLPAVEAHEHMAQLVSGCGYRGVSNVHDRVLALPRNRHSDRPAARSELDRLDLARERFAKRVLTLLLLRDVLDVTHEQQRLTSLGGAHDRRVDADPQGRTVGAVHLAFTALGLVSA